MTLDPETRELGRRRLMQVFEYLTALNQMRNAPKRQITEQPWSRWIHDLPDHPSIRRGNLEEAEVVSGFGVAATIDDDDFVLQVDRAEPPPAPTPPSDLDGWLESGWAQINGRVEFRPNRNIGNDRGADILERFEDNPSRPVLLATWGALRDRWVEAERPAYRARQFFEDLFELRGQIEREGERFELVFGDGILDWRHATGYVHHPVLLQAMALEFDPAIPRFVVREADRPPELYTQLLHVLDGVGGNAIRDLRQQLADDPFISPTGGDHETSFFRHLIVDISPRGQGRYLDEPGTASSSDVPRIWRDPVLFMRARNQGFALALEGIREHLRLTSDLAPPLLRIVGVETAADGDTALGPNVGARGNEDIDVLLTKPANGEQLQIARRLDKYGCVLVQGPPGTGKTHTIGNLIGHLLAQGKSVLVTSHSVKALRVLREQVVEGLRPLCVSVLEAGGENQAQLEGAIGEIVNRLQGADADTLDREAGTFHLERLKILNRLEETRARLRDARADEYRDIVFGGHSWTPSDAARLVAERRLTDRWIPTPIVLGDPLPLSVTEVAEIYVTNAVIRPEDEKELDLPLPESSRLITPNGFRELIDAIRDVVNRGLLGRAELWADAQVAPTPTALKSIVESLVRVIEGIAEAKEWKLAAITAGSFAAAERAPWDDFLNVIQETHRLCINSQTILLRLDPALPPVGVLTRQLKALMEIAEHFEQGGKLGRIDRLLHRNWSRLIGEAKVGGQPPRDREHFEALLARARVQLARTNLVGRWERQLVPLGGPTIAELGSEPERVCIQYALPIVQALSWWTGTLTPLVNELKELGFRWDAFLFDLPPDHARYGALLRVCSAVLIELPPTIAAKIDQLRLEDALRQLEALRYYLEQYSGQSSAKVVGFLKEAVDGRNPDLYQEAFDRLLDLEGRRNHLLRRRQLLAKLAPVAPSWARQIQTRAAPHGTGDSPGDPLTAWIWRQLNDELERRAATSLDALLKQIGGLTDALQRATIELVDRRAWAAQRRRTSLYQQQALMGWRQTMARIGKGTGKSAPKFRAEARALMKKARTAVPVWIMPLARVVETYDPRTTRFDVVIVDEASQADVMALCALYLAKMAVVVGDDQQVSPLAIGQQTDQIQGLINSHLKDIPSSHLYDGKLSIYHLAQGAFGGQIVLREHFRCVPEIIEFSNGLAYDYKIVPLRDSSGVRLKPHTIAHGVDGATEVGNVNRRESLEIASLVVAATEQEEYTRSTFGVISLLGDEQAREIDTLLRRQLTPNEYERHRIICGNAAQFQGDERDVMFLSVVDVPRERLGPHPLRTEGPDGLYKKRYNVAASRARDQMWVVHSLTPATDLQPGDLRRRLIEHARDPLARLRERERQGGRTESVFEREVLERLMAAGFRVVSQQAVGAYRIDLVVHGGGRRLAVECDGDRYHTLDNLDADMERQALLERLGWTFARIRGSVYFRDPDRALESIFARLKELGIAPEGPSPDDTEAQLDDDELRERVVRRAAELRRDWLGNPGAPPGPPLGHVNGPRVPTTDPFPRDPPEPPRPPVQPPLFVPEPPTAPPPTGELPRDRILRAIARHLGRDWRVCPTCGGRAGLRHGHLGPYSDCFHPRPGELRRGQHPIPTSVINAALSDLMATCPTCGSRLKVPAGTMHQTVGCSNPRCPFTINWEEFSRRSDLLGE